MLRRPISRAIALVRKANALAIAAALLMLGGAVPCARAQNADLPEELRSVRDVRFIGMQALRKRSLRAANLRTHQPSIFPWRDKPTLRRDYLAADSAAIVSLYRHYGYLDARVRVLLEADADPRSARVVFTIREGPLASVDSLTFTGVTAYDERDLRRAMLAQPGRAFDPAFVPIDTSRIFSLYQERGFFVHTVGSARRDSAGATHVHVHYTIDEGPAYRVGRVDYSAIGKVRESLARRELLLKPGQIYRRTRLDESIERLYKTTLYRSVQVTPVLDSLQRYDDAFDALSRVTRLDAAHGADVYLKLGNIHYRRGEMDDARTAWERALALDPLNDIVRANVGALRRADAPERADNVAAHALASVIA